MGANVDRFGADDLGVLELLEHMGGPAGGAADGEHGGEQLRGNIDGVEDDRGIQLDVGVEVAAGLQLGQDLDRRFLHGAGEVEEGAVARVAGHLLHGITQDRGAGVAHLVDAVAEAHDPAPMLQLAADVGFRLVRRADRLEHVEDRARDAAMAGTFEGGDRRRLRRDHVRAGGDHTAGREGGGVQAVLADGDEVGVQQIDPVGLGLPALQHVEETLGQAVLRFGRDDLPAVVQPPGLGDQRRHLRLQARGAPLVRGDVRIVQIRVPDGEHRRAHPQDVHARGMRGKNAQRGQRGVRQLARGAHLGAEGVILGAVGELAMPQQVSDLFKGSAPGQFPDVVSAEGQPA